MSTFFLKYNYCDTCFSKFKGVVNRLGELLLILLIGLCKKANQRRIQGGGYVG